jgi:uncharacterized protein
VPGGHRDRQAGGISRHALADEAFMALAAGPGDPATMATLADTRWSVNRALIAAVASRLRGGSVLRQVAAEGLRILSELDDAHPKAVREVVTYPFVQAWATRCLRAAEDDDADLAHLAGIAAAASLRAGVETELALPVRGGAVYVPDVGAFAAADVTAPAIVVRVSPDGVSSRHGPLACQPIRHVSVGMLSVTLDDVDPFRDCGSWSPAGPLTQSQWRRWSGTLTAAAGQLAADVPSYAGALGTGLRAIVPLHPATGGYRHSGTSRDAIGALAIALPGDVDSLAELIVHEVQHLKLAALADLYDLFDRTDDQRYAVPWRADPRPIGAVLHGAYAHLAVAELWRARSVRQREPNSAERFRVYRSWVETALSTLQAATLLPHGERVVAGMCSAVEAWDHDR